LALALDGLDLPKDALAVLLGFDVVEPAQVAVGDGHVVRGARCRAVDEADLAADGHPRFSGEAAYFKAWK
jgi:hypothetical protein